MPPALVSGLLSRLLVVLLLQWRRRVRLSKPFVACSTHLRNVRLLLLLCIQLLLLLPLALGDLCPDSLSYLRHFSLELLLLPSSVSLLRDLVLGTQIDQCLRPFGSAVHVGHHRRASPAVTGRTTSDCDLS